MRNLLLTGVAALAVATAPTAVLAQNAGEAMDPAPSAGSAATDMAQMDKPALSAEQQAMYDGWSPAQQSDYEAWPNEYKVYYWTLTEDQQQGYWALTADQRGQIYKMTPEQQQMAWNSVAQQLAGHTPSTPAGQANPPGTGMPTTGVPDPKMAEQAVRPAMPADESYQGGPYKGALTPPPATAMNKEYPVCKPGVTDSCRNPGGV